MALYTFKSAGTDMLESTAAQNIGLYHVWHSDVCYEWALENRSIWWKAYDRVDQSPYRIALSLLQTPELTNYDAIIRWWRMLCHDGYFRDQARITIVYQERVPPTRFGKPTGLTMYLNSMSMPDNEWYKQITPEAVLPTHYFKVGTWFPAGIVSFDEVAMPLDSNPRAVAGA